MTELIFTIIMMTLSIAIAIITGNYPQLTMKQGGGAGFYPRFLAIILFCLMIVYALENRKKISAVFIKKPALTDEQKLQRKENLRKNMPWCLFIVVLLLLPASLEYLGFIITGIWVVFTASMAIRWKENKLTKKGVLLSAILATCSTLVIYFTFVKVFVILLPVGQIF